MKNKFSRSILTVILFSIAMGFLESTVVIYLRELYYPEGFHFPIKMIPLHIAKVEIIREFSTIIMLIGIAYLAGTNALERFAYFSLAFAIWDICYYIFLYFFISWPDSLFSWDILFLIPVPWLGPVWAPLLIAFLMSGSSIYYLIQRKKYKFPKIKAIWWFIFILGILICIFSFTQDFLSQVPKLNTFYPIKFFSDESDFLYTYIPRKFNTLLFLIGFTAISVAIITQLITLKHNNHEKK